MEGLDLVFRLKWKNDSNSGISVVGLKDTPAITNSLGLFKSNLLRDFAGVDLDTTQLRVAMRVNLTNEWVIDSQPEFERALLVFRHKASKDEIIIINVYKGSNDSAQSERADDPEIRSSESQKNVGCKEPPQWFLTFMQQFRQELIETVSGVAKRNADMDEMRTNTSVPTLFPLNITMNTKAVEELNATATERRIPQKERKPLANILDLPLEVLLNIFLKLDHMSISRCARACKKFYELSGDWQLFPDIKIRYYTSQKYAEWLLDRATNPRTVCVLRRNFSNFIARKLGTWHNLEELSLEYVDISDVGEGSLKNLRKFSFHYCTINCEALGKLLRHSNAICEMWDNGNKFATDKASSLLDLVTCVENLENISIHNDTGIVQQDLHRLSDCAGLKTLSLGDSTRENISEEAALAMKRVARECHKLEFVSFGNMDYITDDVLNVLFTNCTHLKVVRFHRLVNISEEICLMAINVLPHLQEITIHFCDLVTPSSAVKLRDAIARLKRLSSTRTLPELRILYDDCYLYD